MYQFIDSFIINTAKIVPGNSPSSSLGTLHARSWIPLVPIIKIRAERPTCATFISFFVCLKNGDDSHDQLMSQKMQLSDIS